MACAIALEAFGLGDHVGGGELKQDREPPQIGIAWVALARLHIGDPALLQVASQGQLLLREAKLFPASFDRLPQSSLEERRGGQHERSLLAAALYLNVIYVEDL